MRVCLVLAVSLAAAASDSETTAAERMAVEIDAEGEQSSMPNDRSAEELAAKANKKAKLFYKLFDEDEMGFGFGGTSLLELSTAMSVHAGHQKVDFFVTEEETSPSSYL